MGALDWLKITRDSFRNTRQELQTKIDQYKIKPVFLTGTWEEIDENGFPGVRHPPWMSSFPPALQRIAVATGGVGEALTVAASPPTGKAWLIASLHFVNATGAVTVTAEVIRDGAVASDAPTRHNILFFGSTSEASWPNLRTGDNFNGNPAQWQSALLINNLGRTVGAADTLQVTMSALALSTNIVRATVYEFDAGALIVEKGPNFSLSVVS